MTGASCNVGECPTVCHGVKVSLYVDMSCHKMYRCPVLCLHFVFNDVLVKDLNGDDLFVGAECTIGKGDVDC